MEIRALTPAEQKYTYAQSMQLEGQTGSIGYLRGDFGAGGKEFYSSWFDRRRDLKTDDFKNELDKVINSLREDKGFCTTAMIWVRLQGVIPKAAFAGNYCTEYGFRVNTEKHAFLFRCNPTKGDYNFYCCCFVREWLDRHIQKAEQGIRFIDPNLYVYLLSQTAAKSSSHHRGAKKQNAPAVLLTSVIQRLEITSSISASLPSVWNKTERPMSQSPQSRRR